MAIEDEVKRMGGSMLINPPERIETPPVKESLGPNASVAGQPLNRPPGGVYGDERVARDYANFGINQEVQRGFGQNTGQYFRENPSQPSNPTSGSLISPELQSIIDKVTSSSSSISPRQRSDIAGLAHVVGGIEQQKRTEEGLTKRLGITGAQEMAKLGITEKGLTEQAGMTQEAYKRRTGIMETQNNPIMPAPTFKSTWKLLSGDETDTYWAKRRARIKAEEAAKEATAIK